MKYGFTLMALALATAAFGQGYKVYDFKHCTWDIKDNYGGLNRDANLYGFFSHVSPNGKYAVGTDEELMKRAFSWSLDNPEVIEMHGDYDFDVALFDVTDDGTLVGGKRDAFGTMYPAYKPQGANWQLITRGMERLNLDMATNGNVQMGIRATTPNGKYMAGSFYINTGAYSDMGVEVSHLVPVLFKDGRVERIYDDLGIREFMVWDISDDGSIICGMNTAGIGGQNPAFIRDGKLIQLFDCGDERDFDTPDDVYGNVEGGICNSIDNEGNIYGYYAESIGDYPGQPVPFIVPSDCDYAIFLDPTYGNQKFPEEYWTLEWYICGGNGSAYTRTDSHLYSLLDCSDDGRVFVGGGMASLGFGTANIPQLCVYDEPLSPKDVDALPSVVDAQQAQGVFVSGHSLFVKGIYDEVQVYNAQGALVASGAQGQPIALPAAKAVYMVNVSYADGTKCYKIQK